MSNGPIQPEDEAAIRRLIRNLQDAQNQKDGKLFAFAFAQEHDYIAIHGMSLVGQTRGENVRVHQRLYNECKSSVVGNGGEVEARLDISLIRFLTPEIAVMYVGGIFRKKVGHPLPPGALQPRIPAVTDRRDASRGPGRCLASVMRNILRDSLSPSIDKLVSLAEEA